MLRLLTSELSPYGGGQKPEIKAFERLSFDNEKYDVVVCFSNWDISYFDGFDFVEKVFNLDVFSGLPPVGELSTVDYAFYVQHKEELENIYDRLADEKSRECFASYINQRISGKYEYARGLVDKEQYFDDSIYTLRDSECFVDCGAFDGKDTKKFLLNAGRASSAIIFEADCKNIQKIKDELKGSDENYKIIEKAVLDKDCILKFKSDGNMSSKIAEDGDISVECTTIDACTNYKNITFIKMDVEGAELKALHGSKQTITRCSPRLAICIYHKPEDVYEIPNYILSLNPNYKLYVRRYDELCIETVIFAVLPDNTVTIEKSLKYKPDIGCNKMINLLSLYSESKLIKKKKEVRKKRIIPYYQIANIERQLGLIKKHNHFKELLIHFDKFCRLHTINYSLADGTLLGAYRHHQFIPWDDDVDVMMTRDEYNKYLVALKEQDELRDFKLLFCHRVSTQKYIKKGILIDVFVIDDIPISRVEWEIRKMCSRLLRISCFDLSSMVNINSQKGIMKMVMNIVFPFALLLGRLERLFLGKKIFQLNEEIAEVKSSSYFCTKYTSNWRELNRVFKKSWFEDYIDIEMSGYKFMCIESAEDYLVNMYGDWKRIPSSIHREHEHIKRLLANDFINDW